MTILVSPTKYTICIFYFSLLALSVTATLQARRYQTRHLTNLLKSRGQARRIVARIQQLRLAGLEARRCNGAGPW